MVWEDVYIMCNWQKAVSWLYKGVLQRELSGKMSQILKQEEETQMPHKP